VRFFASWEQRKKSYNKRPRRVYINLRCHKGFERDARGRNLATCYLGNLLPPETLKLKKDRSRKTPGSEGPIRKGKDEWCNARKERGKHDGSNEKKGKKGIGMNKEKDLTKIPYSASLTPPRKKGMGPHPWKEERMLLGKTDPRTYTSPSLHKRGFPRGNPLEGGGVL